MSATGHPRGMSALLAKSSTGNYFIWRQAVSNLLLRMLNRRAAGASPERVIDSLGVSEGDIVADIGSGGGYYSLAFGRRVGETGRVYAIDTEEQNLAYVKQQAEEQAIHSIATVLSGGDEIQLPQASIDLIFTRNIVHHLSEPVAYFAALKRFLKPDGRVAVIDYRKQRGFSFVALFRHYVSEETILELMEQARSERVERFDFLAGQSFNVFRPTQP